MCVNVSARIPSDFEIQTVYNSPTLCMEQRDFKSVSIREDMESRKVLLITCFAGISLCFHLPPGDADGVRQVGECVASDGGSGQCRQITQCKSAGN